MKTKSEKIDNKIINKFRKAMKKEEKKKSRRDQFEIVYEILNVCNGGAKISKIIQVVKTDWIKTRPLIVRLLKIGYLNEEDTGKKVHAGKIIIYRTTHRGNMFKDSIMHFVKSIEEVELLF